MIRVIVFLIAVTVLACGFVWLADRPGDVAITWMGYRIETSLMVAALAVLALVAALIVLWTIVRAVLRSPEHVSLLLRHRRAAKGYLAISSGLVAIGAGDLRGARRAADDAARLSPGDPLTLLLTAQAAQMTGDRGGAEHIFREMTRRGDTKLLGLRGLYIEAQRRNDTHAARLVAEEAGRSPTPPAWAGQAVLDHRCAASDWAGALDALDAMKPALDKADYRRKRAVLLTAHATALDASDRDAARDAVMEAVKLAPDLVPAAALAGRRLAEAGEHRKARRIIERAWSANPHPELAEAYAGLRLGDSARERLTRIQKLAGLASGTIESALAVARAALDAREFATARAALAPHLSAVTRRVATLMAEIEQAEHGDEGRVREWMARAMRAAGDAIWTADGTVSEHWLPTSPGGRLDGYVWKVPLAEIGVARPLIEPEPATAAETAAGPVVDAEVPPVPSDGAEPPRKTQAPAATPAVKAKATEPIIPLVHAPDDPGPDAAAENDPLREPVPGPTAPWERLKRLFR